jgi:hypothetical protein
MAPDARRRRGKVLTNPLRVCADAQRAQRRQLHTRAAPYAGAPGRLLPRACHGTAARRTLQQRRGAIELALHTRAAMPQRGADAAAAAAAAAAVAALLPPSPRAAAAALLGAAALRVELRQCDLALKAVKARAHAARACPFTPHTAD